MRTLETVLANWQDELLRLDPPKPYRVGGGSLSHFPLTPKQIVVIGAPPGSGKTLIVTGLVFNALLLDPQVSAVICNCEMPAERLLERELARQCNLPLDWIISREFRTNAKALAKVHEGLARLRSCQARLAFVEGQDLKTALEAADTIHAGIVVLDYIQQLAPKDKGNRSHPGAVFMMD